MRIIKKEKKHIHKGIKKFSVLSVLLIMIITFVSCYAGYKGTDLSCSEIFCIGMAVAAAGSIVAVICIVCIYGRQIEKNERWVREQTNKLEDATNMLSQTVSALSCGVLAYRIPDRKILLVNEELLRLYEWKDFEECCEKSRSNGLGEAVAPEDRQIITSVISNLKVPGDDASYEYRIKHKNGDILKVLAKTKIIENTEGERIVLSSLLDITEKSKLEDKLRTEKHQYREALMNDCEYAFTFDLTTGNVEHEYVQKNGINPMKELGIVPPISFDILAGKIFEWQQAQFLAPGTDKRINRAHLIELCEKGELSAETEYFSARDNLFYRITALLSKDESTGHVLACIIAKDITEARTRDEQTKQALKEAYEAANRANEAKSNFLSRMSHDIRTPMNAIIGMTAIAGTHLEDKVRVKDCLDKITVSGKHLLALINEILDMSKIESGKVDLVEEEFNLSDLMENLTNILHPAVQSRGHVLRIKVKNVEHENVIGDSMRLQQALVNILSNSVKYTDNGGKISVSITEKPTNRESIGCYEFVFEDNGTGMTKEFQKIIFEPFSRADSTGAGKVQGSGLGMSIARNIIRMMDGDIEVWSEPGVGSRFTVTIFLKINEEKKVWCSELEGLSVLIADDEQDNCENICCMLNELGMKSEWVNSGEAMVEKVIEAEDRTQGYFAVIIDWKMPGMDGIETIRQIKKQVKKNVPIIILSAYDWSDIEVEARAAGADTFVSKPLFKSRLLRALRGIIEEKTERTPEKPLDFIKKKDYSGKRILLVEDNELNMEIATDILSLTGADIEQAVNGKVAVDMVAASEAGYYDIVFMDIQMPELNGYEATMAIRAMARKDLKSLPIVAMTANAFAEDIQLAKVAGMNEHIAKPIDFSKFEKILERWLG